MPRPQPPASCLLALLAHAAAALGGGATAGGGAVAPPPVTQLSDAIRRTRDKVMSTLHLPALGRFSRTPQHRERRRQRAVERNTRWLEQVTQRVEERKGAMGDDAAAAVLREAQGLHDEDSELIALRYGGSLTDEPEDKKIRKERSRHRRELMSKKLKLQKELGIVPERKRRGWGSEVQQHVDDAVHRRWSGAEDEIASTRQRRHEQWSKAVLKDAFDRGIKDMTKLKDTLAKITDEEREFRNLKSRSMMQTGRSQEDAKEQRRALRESIRARRREIREELKSAGNSSLHF